ncbi:MAG TPA: YceI family protein [Burkholderiaceae bacterium]|nr:YceI family protein [Burkholderiaceae bacterium]
MTTNPRTVLAAAALAAFAAAPAANAAAIDAARSQIKFGFTQMNVTADGEFKRFNGDISFDPAKPEAGKATLAIDLATVDAGSSEANDLLKDKDWFDVAHFPKATFSSTSMQAVGAAKFQVTGQFSLKGKAATLVIPFTSKAESGGTWLEGVVPISRTAYKVGEGDWADTGTVADTVQIRFKLFVPR